MMWQDFVFTAGGIGFIIALLPMLRKNRPAITSALMTGSILSAFALTYITLGLVFSAITTGLTAALWFVLAYLKWQEPTVRVLPRVYGSTSRERRGF